MSKESKNHIHLTHLHSAHNYHPVEVVVSKAEGVWVYDVEGKRYMDCLSAYSAMNFGHRNRRLIDAALRQMERVTVTSRAFYNDQLGPFCGELAALCGKEAVLPMVSGAEGVETAIKACRRWGYQKKGVKPDRAEIICFRGNFAGRTTTLIGFSDSDTSRKDFGPFTPGFHLAEFGNIDSVKSLVTSGTAGIILEPIQGEGGINVPPDGFLKALRELCDAEKILLIADEIQTGLCRTGDIFACDHEAIKPDIYILGKSLGGGIVPSSAIVADREILDVFDPGSHGSTFGGNPLACAVAREVIALINDEKPHLHAKDLGNYFISELKKIKSSKVKEVRGRGLFVGVEILPEAGTAYDLAHTLKVRGILCKDTRSQVLRLAPPLVITRDEIDWALGEIRGVLE